MDPLTRAYAATYEGGHPAHPRRLTGGWLRVMPDALIYDRPPKGDTPLWTIPQAFWRPLPRPDGSCVAWDASRTLVLGVDDGGETRAVRWRLADAGGLIACATALEDVATAAPDAVAVVRTWPLVAYHGGDPRHPGAVRHLTLVDHAGGLACWEGPRRLMQWPWTAIQSVTTQIQQTAGGFFGLGAAGILEASVANALTRRRWPLVILGVVIDAKPCAVVLQAETPEIQAVLYQTIQEQLSARAPETPLPSIPDAPADLATQLERIAVLHRDGLLDATEYQAAKARVLGAPPAPR